MRALVTGITGFAGAHLASRLVAEGDQVIGVSQSGVWPRWTPPQTQSAVRLWKWDISQPPSPELRAFVAQFLPQVIYHLAAISTPADCGDSQPNDRAQQVNVAGVERMIEFALSLAPAPRVVLVSSSAVYAPTGPDQPPISETWPLAPWRGYGQSKLAAERTALAAVESHSLQVIIARAFQHTGPGQSLRMILPDWAVQFARPSAAPVEVSSLDTVLDLGDVRDVARAYRLLALHGIPGEAYNVGTGQRRSGREILAMLERAAGGARPVLEREGGPKWRPVADTSKLAALCGWKPEIPLEVTVADTLTFWKSMTQ